MYTNQADLGFLNYLLAVFFEDTQDNNVLSVIVVCFVVRSEFGEYSRFKIRYQHKFRLVFVCFDLDSTPFCMEFRSVFHHQNDYADSVSGASQHSLSWGLSLKASGDFRTPDSKIQSHPCGIPQKPI